MIGVLDQENLISQGIRTSQIVQGVPDVDALGSCVANAATAALAALLPVHRLHELGMTTTSPAAAEAWAIALYHQVTGLTGDSASEWPPSDCGSSGAAVCQFLEYLGILRGHQVAHGAENILSLMQASGLIVGQPFLNAWEIPGPGGFIDGDGSVTSLQEQIRGGVAGGHETYWQAIERIAYDAHGAVAPAGTVIRFRNSWGPSWGDHGCAYAHLSTFVALGHWCDFRALDPA